MNSYQSGPFCFILQWLAGSGGWHITTRGSFVVGDGRVVEQGVVPEGLIPIAAGQPVPAQ